MSDNFATDRLIAEILLEKLSQGVLRTEYGEIADIVKTRTGEGFANEGSAQPLGRLQKYCEDLNLPCISVLAVNKHTQLPSNGFIGPYAELHGVDISDPEYRKAYEKQIVKDERKRCATCQDWQKLLDYLGSDYKIPPLLNMKLVLDSKEMLEGRQTIELKLVKERERLPQLRAKCLAYRGLACIVCGFDSASAYGVEGIIDVHHIHPLADGDERKTDFTKDLVPVCPNCHRLLHSKKGANAVYTVNEARAMLGNLPLEEFA